MNFKVKMINHTISFLCFHLLTLLGLGQLGWILVALLLVEVAQAVEDHVAELVKLLIEIALTEEPLELHLRAVDGADDLPDPLLLEELPHSIVPL